MARERATGRRFVTSRLGVKSQTVVPKEVRAALGVGPGDQIGYSIQSDRVILTAIKRPLVQDDPFACFDEWTSEADTKGYASL
jgi:antitoxin component of MazEF toxin-antitoxin module